MSGWIPDLPNFGNLLYRDSNPQQIQNPINTAFQYSEQIEFNKMESSLWKGWKVKGKVKTIILIQESNIKIIISHRFNSFSASNIEFIGLCTCLLPNLSAEKNIKMLYLQHFKIVHPSFSARSRGIFKEDRGARKKVFNPQEIAHPSTLQRQMKERKAPLKNCTEQCDFRA